MAQTSAKRTAQPARKPKRTAAHQKGSVINLRVDTKTRDLIDSAAAITGQNRTEFMLQGARVFAQSALLNQVLFLLNDEDWDNLQATIAAPPPANDTLKALMRMTPVWERS